MRKDQETLNFRFGSNDANLRQTLQNYFDANPKQSRNNLIRVLLANGLAVATGQYHDRELNRLENHIENLSNHIASNDEKLDQIIQGQADLQDAITDQMTDADALITERTRSQQRRNLGDHHAWFLSNDEKVSPQRI